MFMVIVETPTTLEEWSNCFAKVENDDSLTVFQYGEPSAHLDEVDAPVRRGVHIKANYEYGDWVSYHVTRQASHFKDGKQIT